MATVQELLRVVLQSSCLLWLRVAALIFTCVAFSVVAHGEALSCVEVDLCIFCWASSFAGTSLVLLVELFGLQTRIPVSWTNFPITFACYASLLCLSASIMFPWNFLKGLSSHEEIRNPRIAATVFSCLATVAYLGEVSLSRAKPGEVAGYMATVPGLLKVCETFVASVIFVFISNPVSYNQHAALKWCMAVYCICFVLSAAIVVLCMGECTCCLRFPHFLSVYTFLAVVMYLTATIIWPVFKFDIHHSSLKPNEHNQTGLVAIAVLTALNFLIYVADLAHSPCPWKRSGGGGGDEERAPLVQP
ncbi:myeloid-associated differentiation marker homolog [Chanos chanos]|uniref:Myeloid-associated differentiation marker homolog n=1 Tax=Chanos chanos TaxID=29144 RepID=A0A6J2VQK4_CHACN|nr:myeloid-associated differentiation marker homolog [Chanos chanos]